MAIDPGPAQQTLGAFRGRRDENGFYVALGGVLVPPAPAPSTDFILTAIPSGNTLSSDISEWPDNSDITVTGSIADGAQVTVSTSNLSFGEDGPGTIYCYDNFASAVSGEMVPDAPVIGAAYRHHRDQDIILPQAPMRGNSKFKSTDHLGILLPAVTELFFSHTLWLDKNSFWPGEDFRSNEEDGYIPQYVVPGSKWKFTWLLSDINHAGDIYSNLCVPSQNTLRRLSVTSNTHTMTNSNLPNVKQIMGWDGFTTQEAWIRAEAGNPTGENGVGYFSATSSVGMRVERDLVGPVFGGEPGPDGYTYNQINIPGWQRSNRSPHAHGVSDFYLSDHPSRVVVMDSGNPRYAKRASICICRESDWSSQSLGVELRLADMDPATDPIWIYVYNRENQYVNTVGKLLNPEVLNE